MAKTLVLDRVAADLARGLTHPAIQRLSSLVAAYPNDLDLRRRLAAVHRRVGNRIQAGRWDYLTIGADTRDTRAFERAFPSAVARLREVSWPYRAGDAATAYARGRLSKLIAAAEAERPGGAAPTGARLGGGRPAGGTVPSASATATATTAAPDGPAAAPSDRQRWRRWPEAAARWSQLLRSRRAVVPVAAAAAVTAPLAAVGLVTVVEWVIG